MRLSLRNAQIESLLPASLIVDELFVGGAEVDSSSFDTLVENSRVHVFDGVLAVEKSVVEGVMNGCFEGVGVVGMGCQILHRYYLYADIEYN